MTVSSMPRENSTRPITGMVTTAIGVIVFALLAYEAIHFYIRDPLHYIVDYTPGSFSRFWPRRFVLLAHIFGGTLALFTGPFQLWSGLRRRSLRIHHITGYTYIFGIFLAGGCAFYLSFYAEPRYSGIPLFVMAFAWWTTVGMALVAIRRKQIDAHRQWMIRGYVITFAFVTFRYIVDLPVFVAIGDERYQVMGWMCWSVPLLITEVALQWKKTIGPKRSRSATAV